jgi:phage protein D/phage baseplate assembly protein gpV
MTTNFVPVVTLRGNAISRDESDSLFDLRISNETASPSSAVIRFDDPNCGLLDSSFVNIDDKIEIALYTSAQVKTTVFRGKVAALAAEQGPSKRYQLVVTAYDLSQPLTHSLTPFTYKEVKVSDVISKIARRHSLRSSTDFKDRKLEYFLQLDSDHAILDDLALRNGAEWWVDNGVLNFKKRAEKSPINLKWGESILLFSARFSAAGRVNDVTVRGWDPATQRSVKGTSKRSAVAGKSIGTGVKFFKDKASESTRVGGSTTVTEASVRAADEAQALADSMQRDLASEELLVRGETPCQPQIKTGSTVSVTGAGSQLSGSFTVTKVEHIYATTGPMITRFEGGRVSGGNLADQLVAAQRSSLRNRRQFVIGLVTNVKDPTKTGRVKVKYPVISDKEESAWARVVSPGAGKSRGLHLMPDVGDEVLVAFIGGDPSNPVVLGGMWSKNNTPPTPEPAKGDKVSTRSLQLASGAKLTFTESADKSKAVVALKHAVAETFLQFDKDGISLSSASGTKIKIKVGKAQIEMSADGTIKIEGGSVTIKASQNLTLQGQKVSIKGATGVAIDGAGSKVDLAPGKAGVQSGGITEIKGSMVKLN